MGEVYRARDTRLDRTVAIKVLLAHSASRPEVRERFEREARAVSALNHPHICALYDIGSQDGLDFLVMEYLQGETLGQRLARGALSTEQALRYGAQIADALDRAHRHGVVHRDLKPGNIMLTKDGAKLLDFGLAKLRAAAAVAEETRTLALTTEGTVLGTFQYMSPEQLEGKEADARSDIFAFGAVLYEMVTGRKAFEGKSRASVTAAIIEREPQPISQVQPLAAPALSRLIKNCLAKDPDQRRQTAHDVLLDLRWLSDERAQAVEAIESRPRGRERAVWIAAIAIASLCAAAAVWIFGRPSDRPQRVMRLGIRVPSGAWLGSSWWWNPTVAISPNASHVAYIATRDGVTQLYVRPTSEWNSRAIPDTVDAHTPFFSPDGQWVAVCVKGKLVKFPIAGGPSVTIASLDSEPTGGVYWAGDTIYVGGNFGRGLIKVPAGGGTPQPAIPLDARKQETDQSFPEVLPNNQAMLLTIRNASQPSFDEAEIHAVSLQTGERRMIVKPGTNAHFVLPGYLVFLRSGVLLAAPFDPVKLEIKGSPVPVLENVTENPRLGAGQFSISRDGSIVYIPGGVSFGNHELVFVDRAGVARALTAKRRAYEDFTLSPDGRMIATTIEGPVTDTWIHDVARDSETRFTFGVEHRDPAWTSDGKRIAYTGYKDGKWCIFWKASDGSGAEELLLASVNPVTPLSWSADGRVLLYSGTTPTTRSDIWMMPMEGDRKARPLLQSSFEEEWASISPDGRWLAYTSDESGRIEVYVIPFPGASSGSGGKWRISTEGGARPQWAPNGRELYYHISGSVANVAQAYGQRLRMMAVPVETKPEFKAGQPHMLFEGPYFESFHDYAPTLDGRGFIMIREIQAQSAPTELQLVLNWSEELKQRLK